MPLNRAQSEFAEILHNLHPFLPFYLEVIVRVYINPYQTGFKCYSVKIYYIVDAHCKKAFYINNMLIYAIQGNGINMKRRLIIMCERKLCDINALVKFAFGGVYLFLALMLL